MFDNRFEIIGVRAGGIQDPPVKTKPEIDGEVLASIDPSTLEDSFVYVHCYFENQSDDMLIRIWRSTYLIDRASGSLSIVNLSNKSIDIP